MNRRKTNRVSLSITVVFLLSLRANAQQWVTLDGLGSVSVVHAVSADGAFAVGEASFPRRAVRWDSSGVALDLGPGQAFAVSADGSTVVGYANAPTGYQQAFVWTAVDGYVALAPPDRTSNAISISADGSVIFGNMTAASGGYYLPVRWDRTPNGYEGTFFGVADSFTLQAVQSPGARVVSPDGTKFAGQCTVGAQAWSCFFDGAFATRFMTGGTPQAFSENGSVLVGANGEAYRWSIADNFQYLGVVPGASSSWAYACDATARRIVGYSGNTAMLWSDSIGMVDLTAHLPSLGVPVPQGLTLREATGISADGRVIVGNSGLSPAWMVRLPCPPETPCCPTDLDDGSMTGTPSGGVDVNDLLYFLSAFESGSPTADLDDGTSTGTPDGGIDINDLLFFLARFEAGC
jgi:probable HAF family extracellular repeat protein